MASASSRSLHGVVMQQRAQMAGHRRRRIDHGHIGTHQPPDRLDHKGIVGAAEHDRVSPGRQHRLQKAQQQGIGAGSGQVSGLDQIGQTQTHLLHHLHAGGMAADSGPVQPALEGGRCRHHADHAAAGDRHRWLHRRLQAQDQAIGEALAQMVQGHGGGGVAGHHDHLATSLGESRADGFAVGADLLRLTASVGHMGPISEINRGFIRQLPHDLPPDAEPTQARIKDADRHRGGQTHRLR